MGFILSAKIREKLLSKHRVVEDDIAQCFANRVGNYLTDNRENHASDPPTLWFISETDYGRKLKIIFVPRDGNNYIRSAFAPNDNEIRIYDKFGRIFL